MPDAADSYASRFTGVGGAKCTSPPIAAARRPLYEPSPTFYRQECNPAPIAETSSPQSQRRTPDSFIPEEVWADPHRHDGSCHRDIHQDVMFRRLLK